MKREKQTLRKITEIIQPDRAYARTKSVKNMTAQNTTLCKPVRERIRIEISLQGKLEELKKRSKIIHMIAVLQYINGLRISEVLGIRSYDISEAGRILIKAKKGSENRFVDGSQFREYLLMCKRNGIDPFTMFSRFTIYRVYKELGIMHVKQGNKKTAVTHAFRHFAAGDMMNLSKDVATVQRQLGHKNQKSTKHYINGKA